LSEQANFADELLTCETCGRRFVFRVSEQRRMYQQQGHVEPPAECPTCRLQDESGKLTGTVKWFDARKGYGFIQRVDGGEVFFHRSNLVGVAPDDVTEGQPVRFDQQETDKGPEALDVEVAS
jgi:CspA family cold shock protein